MSCILLGDFESFSRLNIPMFLERGSAGFPSPAEDYVETTIDLNELCIQHPAATFFVRVHGESMIEAGIYPGDVLVDWSLKGKHGKIIRSLKRGGQAGFDPVSGWKSCAPGPLKSSLKIASRVIDFW
ncbi:S24 family peptidase [Marinobacter sp. SS5-14b]|uniref:S24 family peptidase n=1 Tax=Marinobacter sp. SS5-14b TaxID=3050456 RepID=UPI0034A440B1